MGKSSANQSKVMVRDLLDLYTGLLIPFMKVRRDIPFPTEPEPDGSQFHLVYARLRKKASIYPPLLEVFDELHEQLGKAWPEYLKRAQEQSRGQ